ncbi:structure-specific endonuclease subunit MUS81-like, partial [Mustelus asterias]
KRRRSENREEQEYKPQKRSGGYALLLTFYREAKKPGYRGFLTKAELQRKAQPLCRNSFTHFKASYRYNAWSAISALIQKDLVIKTSFPARFTLTEKGMKLGEKLNVEHLEEERMERVSPGSAGEAGPGPAESHQEDPLPASATAGFCNQPALFRAPNSGVPGSTASLAGSQEAVGLQSAHTDTGAQGPEPPFTHIPEFTFRPGEFDVVLCIDFIETTAYVSNKECPIVA